MTKTHAPTVIITMAGLGSRFRDAGYDVPKYKIEAQGRTLFAWSMESLRSFISAGSPFIFLTLESDHAEPFIEQQCRELKIKRCKTVPIAKLTDGQATTAMYAASAITDRISPIAIYNIDTYVEPQYLQLSDVRGAGWIPCFPGEGSKWSFALADNDGQVLEVREKQRISPHATVGLYWFESFTLYAQTYRQYYAEGANLERGERYIAPLYNHLIQRGLPVYLSTIPADGVHPLGTPEDVEVFRDQHCKTGSAHTYL